MAVSSTDFQMENPRLMYMIGSLVRFSFGNQSYQVKYWSRVLWLKDSERRWEQILILDGISHLGRRKQRRTWWSCLTVWHFECFWWGGTSGRFNSSRVSTTWAMEIWWSWRRVMVEGRYIHFVYFIALIAFGNVKWMCMNRYSLLMHHDEEELRGFGLTDEMLIEQEWWESCLALFSMRTNALLFDEFLNLRGVWYTWRHKTARPADLNYGCPMVNSFFPHLSEGTC